MLSKEITYEDFDGEQRTETFRFNLSEAELVEMELQFGLKDQIEELVKKNDGPGMFNLWKSLLLKSYGVKSEDGRRFVKSESITEEFTQTQAYSILFVELCSNADSAAAFVNGIMPQQKTHKAPKNS